METEIKPYCVADDLSGVTMAGINRIARRRHPARLPDQSGSTKLAPGQLDGAGGISSSAVAAYADAHQAIIT